MPTLLRAVVQATGLSRRKAFAAIREGRVTIDGRTISDPSSTLEGGDLRFDGRPLPAASGRKVYLLVNKPPGLISTRSDELGRRTVFDLVPPRLRVAGLHSVGRLDRDTSGLLLLTNDGDLTQRLTHPSHEIEKEYWLRLASPVTDDQLERLRRGVEIDGALRRPVDLRRLPAAAAPYQLAITLREGRKRQVRRMFEAVGARVELLRRVREGPLLLGDLPQGGVRPLGSDELQALQKETGLALM